MKFILFHLRQNYISLAAIGAFVILGSLSNPGSISSADIAAELCNTGYTMSTNNLKKFMVDSLGTRRYEGGIFSKQELLRILNALPGDSVYLVNGVFGCNLNNGTGLALSSPSYNGVAFLGWWGSGYCYPCPFRACCPRRFCITSINRDVVNYLPYPATPVVQQHDPFVNAAEQ